MWWATRFTFHSQRILRHLTRLLLASGNFPEARKTFLLYVQLVIKSRETQAGDISLETKGRGSVELGVEAIDSLEVVEEEISEDARKNGAPLGGDNTPSSSSSPAEASTKPSSPQTNSEAEDDELTFLGMLIFGIRMFCRYGNEADVLEGKHLITTAMEIVGPGKEKARTFSGHTKGSLLTARGILTARLVDFGAFFASTGPLIWQRSSFL